MAQGNEEKIKNEKSPTVVQNEKIPTENNTKISGNKYRIPALALIIAFGALLVSLYLVCQNKQLHSQLSASQNKLINQLQQLEQKQGQVEEQLNTKTNDVANLQTKLKTHFEMLDKQVQNALKQKLYQNQDWLLLKARYFLELAQINAHWSDSLDSTTALLEQADNLLTQFTDPQVFKIRQAITQDIGQIKALPRVDISGLLSQLDAAQNSIKSLSINLSDSEKSISAENTNPPTNDSSYWKVQLKNSINVLGKLVVIRRNDQEIKPLMSPLDYSLLKEKLLLNLQEAQWAVLNKKPEVFQLVLNQAISTLKLNFNENASNTAALIQQLTELQQINISQKEPKLDTALPLLNDFIANKKTPTNNEPGGNQ